MEYRSIFIAGFRSTGKTTIGKITAKRIGWKFLDMDVLIESASGKKIHELTKNGTSWRKFRKMENETLKKIMTKTHIVVALGGGATVNSFFGTKNTNLLKKSAHALTVLLFADKKTISARIRSQEMKKQETTRPILDEKIAKKIEKALKNNNEKKRKQILVDEIVKDSLKAYKTRKAQYNSLTPHKINTAANTPEQAAEIIIKLAQQ